MAPLVSVIIPVRGKPNELWFTLQGLAHAGFGEASEIIVVDNEPDGDVEEVCRYYDRPWLRYIPAGEVASVNYPRTVGAEQATGDWLLTIDSHVLLQPGTFDDLSKRIAAGSYPEGALVHFGISFGGPNVYGGYRLTLEENFWGAWELLLPEGCADPYHVAASGNWALLTRRADWQRLGGFNPGFRGYGGDEIYIQLKYWRQGGQVLLDPALRGCHWSGKRGYSFDLDAFLRNVALGGRIVVGDEFLERFAEPLERFYSPRAGHPDLVGEALRAGAAMAEGHLETRQLDAAPLTFDDVRSLWQRLNVQM